MTTTPAAPVLLSDEICWAIARQAEFRNNARGLSGYITKGGTYMLASITQEQGRPALRDLLCISRFGQVEVMSVTTNPQLVDEVKAARA